MSKASAIISVWNGANCIANCIESIKCQTLEDFECIIVDDGSTDDTFRIASESIGRDKRFRIVRTSHEGLSNARNVGLKNASADIIFHIDADDVAGFGMLEHAVDFLEENNLEIAFFDAVPDFDEDCFPRKQSVCRYFQRKKQYRISSGRQMLDEMTSRGDYVYAVFIQAARRSAIRRNFLYGLRAQDILYTTQNLFLAERVGHLAESLYIKNNSTESVSNSRHDARYAWSLLKTITELQKFAEEQKDKGYYRSLERIVAYTFQCLVFAIRNLEKNDWTEISQMSFTERTMLENLGRLAFTPEIKRKLDGEILRDWKFVCSEL